jgi:catechol 2,3-dioxygenase-like lactoylglutathione lyase family enzyme
MNRKNWAIACTVIAAFAAGAIVGASLVSGSTRATELPPGGQFVTGIGGVFFKADAPEESRSWYREHLGIEGDGPGVNFFWRERNDPERIGFTVWSVFPRDSEYFGRESQEFMINFRVRELDRLLARLEREGIEQVGELEEYSYGRFAWVEDGDGNRVELWEPTYDIPD